jgi:hypothetical protein
MLLINLNKKKKIMTKQNMKKEKSVVGRFLRDGRSLAKL